MSRVSHGSSSARPWSARRVPLTPENMKWWTLAAMSCGLFMIILDATVVNVALPSIRQSLHVSLANLEWIA